MISHLRRLTTAGVVAERHLVLLHVHRLVRHRHETTERALGLWHVHPGPSIALAVPPAAAAWPPDARPSIAAGLRSPRSRWRHPAPGRRRSQFEPPSVLARATRRRSPRSRCQAPLPPIRHRPPGFSPPSVAASGAGEGEIPVWGGWGIRASGGVGGGRGADRRPPLDRCAEAVGRRLGLHRDLAVGEVHDDPALRRQLGVAGAVTLELGLVRARATPTRRTRGAPACRRRRSRARSPR